MAFWCQLTLAGLLVMLAVAILSRELLVARMFRERASMSSFVLLVALVGLVLPLLGVVATFGFGVGATTETTATWSYGAPAEVDPLAWLVSEAVFATVPGPALLIAVATLGLLATGAARRCFAGGGVSPRR